MTRARATRTVGRWAIIQMGLTSPERYRTRAAAEREAARANAEADEECGYEIMGDGAVTVVEVNDRRQVGA